MCGSSYLSCKDIETKLDNTVIGFFFVSGYWREGVGYWIARGMRMRGKSVDC